MTNKEKEQAFYELKKERVLDQGCVECGVGSTFCSKDVFEWLWEGEVSPYEPRRFVFKYIDPGASDVPVSKMKSLHYDLNQIQEAMDRCVILCRACLARRERNEQCQGRTTSDSPTDLSRTDSVPLPD